MDSPANKTASSGEQLVPQPHGGAIKQGGNLGNRGGYRTPSKVRKLALRMGVKHLGTLDAIAGGAAPMTERCVKCGHTATLDEVNAARNQIADVKPSDMVQASKALLDVGMGPKLTRAQLEEGFRRQGEVIHRWATQLGLTEEAQRAFILDLKRAWRW